MVVSLGSKLVCKCQNSQYEPGGGYIFEVINVAYGGDGKEYATLYQFSTGGISVIDTENLGTLGFSEIFY